MIADVIRGADIPPVLQMMDTLEGHVFVHLAFLLRPFNREGPHFLTRAGARHSCE